MLHRKPKTLNESVEDIILVLYDNEKFKKYLSAIYDDDAVEGSLIADDHMAALMMRDYAREQRIEPAATALLAPLVRALRLILRRYDISRNQRKQSTLFDMPDNSDNVGMLSRPDQENET